MTSSTRLIDDSLIGGRRVALVGKLAGMPRKEFRNFVRDHGGQLVELPDETTDVLIIGEEGLPIDQYDFLANSSLADAAASGQLQVIRETQLWQSLGLVEQESDAYRLYTPAMLARLLDVPISTIRRWHRRGLITPSRQVHKLAYFDFQEVASARRIAELISSGASATAIESKLSKLAEHFPELQRPLSQLSVIVEGRDVLLRAGDGLIEPGGQKRFDFGAADGLGRKGRQVIAIDDQWSTSANINQFTSSSQFIELASELEDRDDLESAAEVYRSMMLKFGPSSDVCFRLAEILFQFDDLTGARERYYMAIELDSSYVEARASLGCVLVDLGKPDLAISAFEGALQLHSEYPDVLYHLARVLDDAGRAGEAELHWRRFLELSPKSPWADEARDRLDGPNLDNL